MDAGITGISSHALDAGIYSPNTLSPGVIRRIKGSTSHRVTGIGIDDLPYFVNEKVADWAGWGKHIYLVLARGWHPVYVKVKGVEQIMYSHSHHSPAADTLKNAHAAQTALDALGKG